MGDYRVVVEATGGHGCQRETGKDEGKIFGCRRQDCPDCITQEYVAKMKAIGQHVKSATLIHWPTAAQWGGTPIVDEFHGPTYSVKSYTNNDGSTGSYLDYMPVHRTRNGFFPGHPKVEEWTAAEKAKRASETE